jgi:hypothetical protein
MHPQTSNIVIDNTNIVMETNIEVNDAIEEEKVKTSYKTPAKKKAKRT